MGGNLSGLPPSHCVIPAPATKLSTVPLTGPHVCGWVFTVPRTEDSLLHKILGKGNRVRIIRTATVIINAESPKRILQFPVVAYWDPRHTRDFHRNLIPDGSPAHKDAMDALGVMRKAGMSKESATKIFNHLAGRTEDIEPLLIRPSLLPGREPLVTLEPKDCMRYTFHEFEDVEVNFKHPLNNTPSPPPAPIIEKNSKAQVHNKTTLALKGVVVSPVGKAIKAPPPRINTAGNSGRNQKASSVKDLFEAARGNREPPAKRQRMTSRETISEGRVARRAVVGAEEKDDESDPEWDPRGL